MTKVLKGAVSATDVADNGSVANTVRGLIEAIRARGDVAVREYSRRFDNWDPDDFLLTAGQVDEIVRGLSSTVVDDILAVQQNVRQFAQRQRESILDFEIEDPPGVHLGQRNIPIERAGAYIPGGRYPLVASAHMTIVTAKVAGVDYVSACTPPIGGTIPAVTVAAMHLAGADEIRLLGGVQAVAALAIGTETISKVDFIAGPGNAYVAEAKRQLFGEVGIDLLAGPTEILVVADDSADPFTVAVDLLSQAEHGPDSAAILVSTSTDVAHGAMEWIERLLPDLPTRAYAEQAWRNHGQVVVVDGGTSEAYRVADSYAAEHVEVLTAEPREALDAMSNYGALFLGPETCVSFGDKVIGTNHTLPTRGAARFTGGLWVGKYLKTVTYQQITDAGASAELGTLCGRASRMETFEGHARSGDIRAAAVTGEALPWLPGPSYT